MWHFCLLLLESLGGVEGTLVPGLEEVLARCACTWTPQPSSVGERERVCKERGGEEVPAKWVASLLIIALYLNSRGLRRIEETNWSVKHHGTPFNASGRGGWAPAGGTLLSSSLAGFQLYREVICWPYGPLADSLAHPMGAVFAEWRDCFGHGADSLRVYMSGVLCTETGFSSVRLQVLLKTPAQHLFLFLWSVSRCPVCWGNKCSMRHLL